MINVAMKYTVGKRILFAVCSAVLVFSLGSLGAEPASEASSPKGIPIIVAARDGDIDTVRDLIEKGTDVNTGGEDGETALMLAALNGHTETVKILLEAGADVNAATKSGWTALILAAVHGYTDIVNMFLDAGADVNAADKDGRTALMATAEEGHTDTVKMLLKAGADVNATMKDDGPTALMAAAIEGHADIVKVLLDAGGDVNAANKDGWTPLMRATQGGYPHLTKILLDAGADVNATMKNGGTALIVAAVYGHTDIAKMFLDAGADVNAVDKNGSTALSMAIQVGHTDMTKLLLDAGADTDSTPEEALKAAQKAHGNRVIENQQERFVLEKSGVSVPKQIGSLKMTEATDLNPDGSDVVLRFEDPGNWLKISLYVYKSPPSTKGPFLMLDSDGKRVLEDREEIIQKYNGVYKLTAPSKSYEDEYSSMVKKISLLGLTLENESRNMAVPTRDDSPIAYVAYLTETENIDGNDIRFVWEAYLYSIPGYFVKIYCTYPEPLWQEATMTEIKFIQSINWDEILPDTGGDDKDR